MITVISTEKVIYLYKVTIMGSSNRVRRVLINPINFLKECISILGKIGSSSQHTPVKLIMNALTVQARLPLRAKCTK